MFMALYWKTFTPKRLVSCPLRLASYPVKLASYPHQLALHTYLILVSNPKGGKAYFSLANLLRPFCGGAPYGPLNDSDNVGERVTSRV